MILPLIFLGGAAYALSQMKGGKSRGHNRENLVMRAYELTGLSPKSGTIEKKLKSAANVLEELGYKLEKAPAAQQAGLRSKIATQEKRVASLIAQVEKKR